MKTIFDCFSMANMYKFKNYQVLGKQFPCAKIYTHFQAANVIEWWEHYNKNKTQILKVYFTKLTTYVDKHFSKTITNNETTHILYVWNISNRKASKDWSCFYKHLRGGEGRAQFSLNVILYSKVIAHFI